MSNALLLQQLEKKVENALEVIELLRMEIDGLEEENVALKAEQEQWRDDLAGLLRKFDQVDLGPDTETQEELFAQDENFSSNKSEEELEFAG